MGPESRFNLVYIGQSSLDMSDKAPNKSYEIKNYREVIEKVKSVSCFVLKM